QELPSPALVAAVKAGALQLAVLNEPFVTVGIRNGLWGQPVYNTPRELGPYIWTSINVRADTIDKQSGLTSRFMRAMIKGLKAIYADPRAAITVAKSEFPAMSAEDVSAAIKRSLDDELWSRDGLVTPQAWDTAQKVARGAGLLKQDVAYSDIFDM